MTNKVLPVQRGRYASDSSDEGKVGLQVLSRHERSPKS